MSPQDRADRAARYANNQEEVEAARLAALQARQAEAEAKKEIAHRERRYGATLVTGENVDSLQTVYLFFYTEEVLCCMSPLM